MKAKVLIAQDGEGTGRSLSRLLTSNGYLAITAKSGEQTLKATAADRPDIVLLDLELPDIDGIEILRRLRQLTQIPVVIVSARDMETDKVHALDLGADDYVTRPFGSLELLARIRTALRHSGRAVPPDKRPGGGYTVGSFAIDFKKHRVTVDGKDVHLTQIEFKIVELIARNPGQVLAYGAIMEHIWGPYVPSDNRILRVNMTNIRRKIEKNPAQPQYILTETGIGYRMAE